MLFSQQQPGNVTRKDIAKQILKNPSTGNGINQDIEVTVNVHPLQPEEILALLCAAAGRMEKGILFGICNILEFFRTYHNRKPFAWNSFLEIINSYYQLFRYYSRRQHRLTAGCIEV